MPYVMCPKCGTRSHLSVGDVATWYKEQYPDLPFGSVAPAICYFCFPEIGVGDTVVLREHGRRLDGVKAAVQGTVTAVVSGRDGSLYDVRFETGTAVTCIRSELRKLFEKEVTGKKDEVSSDDRS